MESVEEIISLRRAGLREKAVEHLEAYCHSNRGDLDMSTTLKVWKKEVLDESWTMARRNAHHSSCDMGYGVWSRLNEVWSYRFKTPLAQEFLPDIPSPIITHDMVLIPDPSMQSFLGLLVSDGKEVTSPSILGTKLTYASTPVYISPFLLFASNGAIHKISLREDEISHRPVFTDPRIQTVGYASPVATHREIIFTLKGWVLLYRPDSDERQFIQVELTRPDDLLRSPVLWEEEFIFVSRFGQIIGLAFEGDGQGSIRRIGDCGGDAICSPPCLVRDRLYVEFLDQQGLRGIYAYDLKGDGGLEKVGVEEGVCSPNDTHLDFPPVAFQEGVIISSDITPRLYYVLGEHPLKVLHIDVQVQTGRLRVPRTSHIFSCVLGNRLMGNTPGGFFHIDLLNPKEGVIEIFRPKTEIITQPVNYGQRLFFITWDGVRCFIIR